MSDAETIITPTERWRLPALGQLCAVIELESMGVGALYDVKDDDEGLLRDWAFAVTSMSKLRMAWVTQAWWVHGGAGYP
jgi:hypothetical protein